MTVSARIESALTSGIPGPIVLRPDQDVAINGRGRPDEQGVYH
jgi:hypothetical protein